MEYVTEIITKAQVDKKNIQNGSGLPAPPKSGPPPPPSTSPKPPTMNTAPPPPPPGSRSINVPSTSKPSAPPPPPGAVAPPPPPGSAPPAAPGRGPPVLPPPGSGGVGSAPPPPPPPGSGPPPPGSGPPVPPMGFGKKQPQIDLKFEKPEEGLVPKKFHWSGMKKFQVKNTHWEDLIKSQNEITINYSILNRFFCVKESDIQKKSKKCKLIINPHTNVYLI